MKMDISREQWDRLYRYCLALAGQPADAEDLLHGAVERYLAATTEVVQNPLAWMRRVARNLYYDQLRRSQRGKRLAKSPSQAVSHGARVGCITCCTPALYHTLHA
ncbi:sigma factor [Stutzerimonas chloritidismutans]|uniref:RNA polymerase sigma factor n=1 Tax=Stutzerimonas chloritidismutans TaxID=203192 RepID=UPI000A02A6BB